MLKKLKEKYITTAIGVIIFLFMFAISMSIGNFFSSNYHETNQLKYYFWIVLYEDSLMGVLMFFLLFVSIFFYMWKDLKELNINIRKIWGYYFLITVLVLLVVNVFKVSRRYEDVVIDGVTPSKSAYKYNILLDVLGQETKTENIPIECIEGHWDSYTTGRRGSTGSSYSYYIRYTTGDNVYFSAVESAWLMKYIEDIKLYKEAIQIEYYVHSGVIKSVEGYNKFEQERLEEQLELLVEEKEKQIIREQEAELKRKEEARKINSRRYDILNGSIGRDIEDIKKQLEEEQIPLSREIFYISSKMYEINCLAFCDNEAVYVVKDDLCEDMITVPTIEQGMTKEEIVEVLTEAEFDYTCDEFSCDSHGKNKLHTRHFSPGALAPRGYKVWFSVDK